MWTCFGGEAGQGGTVGVSDVSGFAAGAESRGQIGVIPYIVCQAAWAVALPGTVPGVIAVYKGLCGSLLFGGIQTIPISNVIFSHHIVVFRHKELIKSAVNGIVGLRVIVWQQRTASGRNQRGIPPQGVLICLGETCLASSTAAAAQPLPSAQRLELRREAGAQMLRAGLASFPKKESAPLLARLH